MAETTGVPSFFICSVLSCFGRNPVSLRGEMDLADKKKKSPQVIITFNGKKHTMEEWTKKETAADKEKLLNWNSAFPENQNRAGISHPQGQKLPDRVKSYLRVKHIFSRERKKWRPGRPMIHEAVYLVRHFWLPAAAAVVIGLAIGLTMLMIFAGQTQSVGAAWTARTGSSGAAAQSAPASASSRDLGLSAYVIQAGVYSTKAKAAQAAAQLQNNGSAAIMVDRGTTAIFIGAASAKPGAAKLDGYYKSQGIPAYQKSLQFNASAKPAVLKTGSAATFIVQGKALMQNLLEISDEAINGNFSLSGQTVVKMDKLINAWKLPDGGSLNSAGRSLAVNLQKQAGVAASMAHTLQVKKSGASFNAYQQSLLETIILYGELIKK